MKPLSSHVIAAIALLLISACGGGSSGGGSSPLSQEDQQVLTAYQQAVGGQPLSLSASQIRSTMNARRNAADRTFVTDVLWSSFAGRGRYSSSCSGATCTVAGTRYGLSDIDFTDADLAPLMTLNGVSLVAGEQDIAYADGTRTLAQGLGGWLDHNGFFVEIDTLADTNNVATAILFYGVSIGNDTGSNPVGGSAKWSGAMVGMDTIDILAIGGSATVTADFSAANLDIAFTNIHDENLGRRSDIRWNDVPMASGGFYAPGLASGDRIEGTFYGPNHSEVGGVFEHSDYVGAFGARRQ